MTLLEELLAEAKTLCDRAHGLGATMIVGIGTYDPREDGDSYNYVSAGSYLSCIGLTEKVRQMVLNPDADDEENP